jgi:O-acetyl-ADP-ribose deacetylase (regulator of RNase III)
MGFRMMEPSAPNRKECFVIMPFDEKQDAQGHNIDFDEIYKHLIKSTVEALGIRCIRCDEIAEAGWIHSKMFERVHASDVAIVDITSLNPNVFYELGVRHALADSVTVLIRRIGTTIPFNIQGLNVIDYDPEKMASVEKAKKKIADYIRNGLKLGRKDSPVYEVLNLRVDTMGKELTKTETFTYQLREMPDKQICLITGDIRHVKGIDVWVNSENTNMQMARHDDRSISSVIRYYGASRKGGRVVEDVIANELMSAVGENANIPPGEVIATGSGALERTHGVKRIFHAAAVVGQVGKGYTPIADVAMCVRNALELADSSEFDDVGLKTMLFPLMGTGTGRGAVEEKARELIGAAISHMTQTPPCRIDRAYFLVLSEKHLEACQRVLQEASEVHIV